MSTLRLAPRISALLPRWQGGRPGANSCASSKKTNILSGAGSGRAQSSGAGTARKCRRVTELKQLLTRSDLEKEEGVFADKQLRRWRCQVALPTTTVVRSDKVVLQTDTTAGAVAGLSKNNEAFSRTLWAQALALPGTRRPKYDCPTTPDLLCARRC